MKASIKLALVGAAALVSTTTFANTLLSTTSSTNGVGSDLILFVSDLTTGHYYAYDTGVNIDAVETVAQVQAAHTANGNALITQSPATGTLAFSGAGLNLGTVGTFISGLASTDNIQWAIDAADGRTTAGATVGASRLLVSSTSTSQPYSVTQGNLTSGGSNLKGLISAWNAQGNVDTSTSVGWGTGTYGNFGPFGWIGSNTVSGAALGTAQSLFMYSGNGVAANTANVQVTSGTFTLSSAGVLSYTPGTPPVPVPGAAWLLGSGLFGLVGIARRRRAA